MSSAAPTEGQDSPAMESPVFLAKYRKIKSVGKGSFGEAILCRSKADGRRYIVKAIDSTSMSPKEKRDITNEIRIMASLNHPNIVKYHEHFEDGPLIYIAMEYADAGDLHQRIREQRKKEPFEPFDPKLCMFWMLQIAMALKYLHDRHILHRDLKTANIFLTSRNVVKLGDFGISTVLQSTMACAKTVCGTPYYFSPELCQSKPYNNKSDVWALGIIFYEVLTLARPFNAKSLKDLIKKILVGLYDPLPTTIPLEVRKLSAWLLALNPAQRPNVNAILEAPFVQECLKSFSQDLEDQSKREKEEIEAAKASQPARPTAPAAAPAAAPVAPAAPAADPAAAALQMKDLRAMPRGDLRAMLAKPNPALQAQLAPSASPSAPVSEGAPDDDDESEAVAQKAELAKKAVAIVGAGPLGGHEEEFGDAAAPSEVPAVQILLANGTPVDMAAARVFLERELGAPLLNAALELVQDKLASPAAPKNVEIQRELNQLLGLARAAHSNAVAQLALAESKAHAAHAAA